MVAASSPPQSNTRSKMESPGNRRTPATKSTPQQHDGNASTESLLESAVKSIFGPCVGAVDVASYLIQGTCHGDDEEQNSKNDTSVLGMKIKKPAPGQNTTRRQGETLEFLANAGFDDDVSAISARTLEEMERLDLFNKKKKNGRPAQNLSQKQDLDWTYQVRRPPSAQSNNSLGVSTSGSASSAEGAPKIRSNCGPTPRTRNSRLMEI